jgi:hypothetical protein
LKSTAHLLSLTKNGVSFLEGFMKSIVILLFSVLLFILSCENLAEKPDGFKEPSLPAMLTSEVLVKKRVFGVYKGLGRKTEVLETKTIKHSVGSPYGWRLTLDSTLDVVPVREELVLPDAGNWETSGATVVSEDKRIGTSNFNLPVYQGAIENSWAVADGDPKGDHIIRVWVDGAPAAEFKFEIK